MKNIGKYSDLPGGFNYYPSEQQVDHWVEELWQEAAQIPFYAQFLEKTGFQQQFGLRQTRDWGFIRFMREGEEPFYGYWQPANTIRAPLLVNFPGYGAEINVFPELVSRGFHVLHINPLGYMTPDGPDERKRHEGFWQVLPETILTKGAKGYRQWLVQGMLAAKWAMSLPKVDSGRISFFGTSQGGAGALLLGSLMRDHGVKSVAADLPFLTNFPLAQKLCAARYDLAFNAMACLEREEEGWHALGYIDTLSHAHRLSFPVMLTAGMEDTICPPPTIRSLYEVLPSTRMYCELDSQNHNYTVQFPVLAESWFRLYA